MRKKRFIKPIIVGVIVFFASLIVDFFMGRSGDYAFAITVALVFAFLFYLFQFFLSFRSSKKRKY